MSKQPLLEISHYSKKYDEKPAVTDLSLTVYEGEIFGFIGHNGAGKSTTIKSVVALILSASTRSNLIQSLVAIVTTGVTISILLNIINKMGVILQKGLGKSPEELASEFVTVFSQNYRFSRLFQLGIVEMQPVWTALFIVLSAIWYGFFVFRGSSVQLYLF